MFEAFLHGLGWCFGAVVAASVFIVVAPLLRGKQNEFVENSHIRTHDLLEERNRLTVSTNEAFWDIAASLERIHESTLADDDPSYRIGPGNHSNQPDPPNPSEREVIHGA